MKKIPCLFQRVFRGHESPILLRNVTPGCEWVLNGEGVATRKYDGVAVMLRGGELYARLDCKRWKVPSSGAIPCDPVSDPITGHWPHWVKATRPEDEWIREAHQFNLFFGELVDGTYEACGPKIWGNAEALEDHQLHRHGAFQYTQEIVRDYDGLKAFLQSREHEGIVFHHEDGRMAKIRRRDFQLKWPCKFMEE